jgi:hypothetical protein
MPHKLDPHSYYCIFLGYSPNHKGYQCINLLTHQVIISRHVVFDENVFPLLIPLHLPTLIHSSMTDALMFLFRCPISHRSGPCCMRPVWPQRVCLRHMRPCRHLLRRAWPRCLYLYPCCRMCHTRPCLPARAMRGPVYARRGTVTYTLRDTLHLSHPCLPAVSLARPLGLLHYTASCLYPLSRGATGVPSGCSPPGTRTCPPDGYPSGRWCSMAFRPPGPLGVIFFGDLARVVLYP